MARGFSTTFGSGSSDSIQSGTFSLATQTSFSAWIWINGQGGNGTGNALNKNDGGGANGFYIVTTTGLLNFTRRFSTTSGTWTIEQPSSSAWHHVCFVYDASSTSNVPIVYVDGVSQTVTTGTAPAGTAANSSGQLTIGNNVGGGIRAWDGMLAECAYWSSALLTASEAAALAKGIAPSFIRPVSLAIYLPLFGAQSNEPDWGPSHYTQTITGTKKQNHPPVSFWTPPASILPATTTAWPWRRPGLTYRRITA